MDISIGIIVIASIIIFSYLSTLVTSRFNFPSVFLLIGLGVVTKYVLDIVGFSIPELKQAIGIIGSIGLILIVLEASLEIVISRSNWRMVFKAMIVAITVISVTSLSFYIIFKTLLHLEGLNVVLASIALSVLSSAIVIPSINKFPPERKYFLTLEAAFSDVFGVVAFNFFQSGDSFSIGVFGMHLGGIVITICVAIISVFLIVLLMKINKTKIKYFIILGSILLLYGIGKVFHFPVLILVLVFGLFLANFDKLKIIKPLGFFFEIELKPEILKFEEMNNEISFIVRTFFFFIFGLIIDFSKLLSIELLAFTLLFLAVQYCVRVLVFLPFYRNGLVSSVFASPRGLITILLFYTITFNAQEEIVSNIMFLLVVLSILIMTIAIMFSGIIKQGNNEPQLESKEL